MAEVRTGRVYVGVDGSLASLRALREAAGQARQRYAELRIVHVRPPARSDPVPAINLFGVVLTSRPDPEPERWADAAARGRMAGWVQDAFCAVPAGLAITYLVLVGDPETTLARLGRCDEDLLVVGTNGGRRRHHLSRPSVSRYCAKHSRCPVLVTPCSELARTLRLRALSHGHVLPRDPWKELDALDRCEPKLIN